MFSTKCTVGSPSWESPKYLEMNPASQVRVKSADQAPAKPLQVSGTLSPTRSWPTEITAIPESL